MGSILAIIIPIIVVCISLAGLILRINYCVKRDASNQLRRAYERFDEFKRYVEKNFIRRDICQLKNDTHNSNNREIKEELKEIKVDIKSLLRKANGDELN